MKKPKKKGGLRTFRYRGCVVVCRRVMSRWGGTKWRFEASVRGGTIVVERPTREAGHRRAIINIDADLGSAMWPGDAAISAGIGELIDIAGVIHIAVVPRSAAPAPTASEEAKP